MRAAADAVASRTRQASSVRAPLDVAAASWRCATAIGRAVHALERAVADSVPPTEMSRGIQISRARSSRPAGSRMPRIARARRLNPQRALGPDAPTDLRGGLARRAARQPRPSRRGDRPRQSAPSRVSTPNSRARKPAARPILGITPLCRRTANAGPDSPARSQRSRTRSSPSRPMLPSPGQHRRGRPRLDPDRRATGRDAEPPPVHGQDSSLHVLATQIHRRERRDRLVFRRDRRYDLPGAPCNATRASTIPTSRHTPARATRNTPGSSIVRSWSRPAPATEGIALARAALAEAARHHRPRAKLAADCAAFLAARSPVHTDQSASARSMMRSRC